MSSFDSRHKMFLFETTYGKKKLAYGKTPEDALEVLSLRLSEEEMAQIHKDKWMKINQRQMQQYVDELG